MGVFGFASGSAGVSVFGDSTDVIGIGVWGSAREGSGGIGGRGAGSAWDFYSAGGGSDYGPFTGAHEVRVANDMPSDIRPGMIVSATARAEARKKDNGEISLSSTLPTVVLATKVMDKAVLGVLVSETPLSRTTGMNPMKESGSAWQKPWEKEG